MPAYDEKVQKDINEGRLILGGCIVSPDNPAWQCSKCGLEIYKTRPDFDQI
jgi:YgiT-type zinc finger domain-containing protein